MGIITDTLNTIDGAVANVAQQAFEAGAGSVGTVISGGAVVLLCLMAFNVLAQIRPMTTGSFMAFGVKIALVGIFAQSWANFAPIFAILTDVPQSVGNSFLGLTSIGDEGGLYASLDRILARVTEYGDAIGDNAGWVFGAMLGVVFFLVATIFAAVGAGIIAYASIMLTVMIAVAPFAIVCSMFEATKSIFDAWSRSTIGYAVMPMVTGVMLGIIISAGELIMSATEQPEGIEEVSLMLPFLAIMALSIGVMAAIPAVAQNITGAFGLASNAAGLTGLTREGMVRGGEMGGHAAGHVGGAMTRSATGHSPRELGAAARHGASDAFRQNSLSSGAQTVSQALATQKAFRDARLRYAPKPADAAGRAATAALGAAGGPVGTAAVAAARAATSKGGTSS